VHRLLVLEDRPSRQRELIQILGDEPCVEHVAAANGLDDALHHVLTGLELEHHFAVAFVHLDMPEGVDRTQALRELWSVEPELQIVLCAEADEHLEEFERLSPGFHHKLLFLRQPYDESVVRQLARTLTEKWELARRDRTHIEDLEQGLERSTRELAQSNHKLEAQVQDYKRAVAEANDSSSSLQASFQELERSHAAAQAATQAKSEFLANMSHEIRTPMTAILGYADLLRDPDISRGDHHTYLKVIRRNGDHLLELINDILDISKIEAGHMTIEQVRCSPIAILSEVASLMRVRARKKQLEFEIEFDGPVPETVLSDPTRLRQVLLNLVGNAIKFTRSGRVDVVCRMLTSVHDECPRLSFAVRDTGVGMASGHEKTLFHAFSQGDNSTTRRFGGTGLGLAISKRLATMLGGDIRVESELGQGSTFTLVVETGSLFDVQVVDDVAEALSGPQRAGPAETDAAEFSARVLLAEDGRDNQLLITHYLRKAGAEVEVADDGAEALRLGLDALESSEPYDLILMDMHMPELDGYEVTGRLRAAGWKGPIVALTANAMPGDRQKCLDAGCDEYFTKPVNRTKLIDLCVQMTAQNEPDAPLPRAETPAPAPSEEL
jgi:signal transduction histidine kinase/ActR/RegA family two-component response regulator